MTAVPDPARLVQRSLSTAQYHGMSRVDAARVIADVTRVVQLTLTAWPNHCGQVPPLVTVWVDRLIEAADAQLSHVLNG